MANREKNLMHAFNPSLSSGTRILSLKKIYYRNADSDLIRIHSWREDNAQVFQETGMERIGRISLVSDQGKQSLDNYMSQAHLSSGLKGGIIASPDFGHGSPECICNLSGHVAPVWTDEWPSGPTA